MNAATSRTAGLALALQLAAPAAAQAPARVTVYVCAGGSTVEVRTDADGGISFHSDRAGGVTSLAGCRPAERGAPGVTVARLAARDGRRARVRGGDFADGERVAWIDPRTEEVFAVGRAVRSRDERGDEVTHVELGVGEVVPVNAVARRTERLETADPWAPPRYGNVWQLVLGVRPFLPVNDDRYGVGAALWHSLRYRARAPFSISAEWEPTGLVSSRFSGTDVTTVFVGLAGVDERFFEVAAGGGLATHVREGCCGGGLVAVVAERVRLGGLDGLHVEVTAVESVSPALLQSLLVRAQLPLEAVGVARDWWLVARGGGGAAGYGYGEAGTRALVVGNGWRPSLFLTFAVGVFGMMARTVLDQLALRVGPSLSAELEARF